MEDGLPSLPRMSPLILIEKYVLHILASTEGLDVRLLGALACKDGLISL